LEYINHFKEPKDDVERSYNQYRCLMKLYGKVYSVLINIASAPLAWYYYLFIKTTEEQKSQDEELAIFLRDGKPCNILPDEVIRKYKFINADPETGSELSAKDRKYIRGIIKRYPFAWHFVLKVILKIALYRYLINRYSPVSIIVCNEYSFTSSVLTDYCHKNNTVHIDVMHGEKLLYMRDSFFHFDECHVWNEGYKELFGLMRAEKTQFHVSIPGSLRFESQNSIEKSVDYTYYLAAEDEDTLRRISDAMKRLRIREKVVAIRPHPRYSKMDIIKDIFSDFEIEDCNEISIEKSVLRSRNAVSLYSTVLNQAFHNGVNVIIDDVSNNEYYRKLAKLRYVMLAEKHILLSELISEEAAK